MSRYDKLGPWPEQRPNYITFIHDYTNSTVYVANGNGTRLLAIPFDRFRAEIDGLPERKDSCLE